MIKHTHMITISRDDYRDSFFFTPRPGVRADADAEARVCAERKVEPGYFAMTVDELPSAADTRARGRFVEEPATAERPFARRYYELPTGAPERPRSAVSAPRVVYYRVQHAAHYDPKLPDVGHDLERWDAVQAWNDQRPEGVPADAERHSGYVDKEGRQHVLFMRRAPLTGDHCMRCSRLKRGEEPSPTTELEPSRPHHSEEP